MFFLGDNEILLHDSLPQLQTQRQGDIFLMQCFLLPNSTDKELRCLVDCREYLQGTTLADITTADGTEIMLHTRQGLIYKRKLFSYLWPRQSPRKKLDWNLWRHTLKPMIQNTTNRSLNFSLGRWEKEALHHWK